VSRVSPASASASASGYGPRALENSVLHVSAKMPGARADWPEATRTAQLFPPHAPWRGENADYKALGRPLARPSLLSWLKSLAYLSELICSHRQQPQQPPTKQA
jgi:hypothetical protein